LRQRHQVFAGGRRDLVHDPQPALTGLGDRSRPGPWHCRRAHAEAFHPIRQAADRRERDHPWHRARAVSLQGDRDAPRRRHHREVRAGRGERVHAYPSDRPLAGLARGSNPCEHLLLMDPPSQEAIELGLNTAEPATLVVDLNCAFASIEQQHDPALRGRPLAIAAYATDAATIVSSSREARDLGIKTGMRVFEAKAIFPSVLVREPDPPLYRTASDKLIEIMLRHSPEVPRMSIDEASVNLAGTPGLKKLGPEGVGLAIKRAIREEIGECVTASVGVSTSIWMAKQASNLDKRDGLQRIDHRNLVAVFERLALTDLSGIAHATAGRLARGGIHTPVEFLRATAPRLRLAGMHAEVARGWSMRLRGFEV